jgi:hypothetical protein
MVIAMNGLQPRALVGAAALLLPRRDGVRHPRHNGVQIGKKDYVSQVGAFIQQKG